MSAEAALFTVTRAGREEHVLRFDAEAPELAEPPEPAERENPKNYEFKLMAGLVRLNGGDPVAVLRRWLEGQTKSGVKARSRLAALLETESQVRERAAKTKSFKEARAENERATGKKSETHRKTLQRTLDALVRIAYVHDPENKTALLAAEAAADWVAFRRGGNLVLIQLADEVADAERESVSRLLADRAKRVRAKAKRRGVGQEKMSHGKDSAGREA